MVSNCHIGKPNKHSFNHLAVPVVVVFTKCEALQVKAIEALEDQGYDFDEAVENAQKYAEEHLWNVHLILEAMKYPPRGHVYLQGK